MEDLRLWLGGAGLTLADWQFPIVSGGLGGGGKGGGGDEGRTYTACWGRGDANNACRRGGGGEPNTPTHDARHSGGVERWKIRPEKTFEFR